MQSPEILLKDLNTALRELRGAARVLNDERLDDELLPAIRRLLLAEVLGNTWILAIGGSQGAGKTTLLRTLYELQDEESQWLKPNEGRGEKLPVLVLEDSEHDQVQGAVRRLREVEKGQYRLVQDDVNLEDFQKAVSDPDPEVLLPVLKVPKRYFPRSGQAWLLLPGYEKQDRQNKEWQELMRQALVAAAGCIIVADQTRLADQQQVEIATDMLSNELRGTQALVVISKTEAVRGDPERLKQLRTTAQEVFGMKPDQAERWVVCTGSDDGDYIAEWQPRLKAAIQDLAVSGGGDRQAQLARLEEVLSRDLSRALNAIRSKSRLFFQQREGGENGGVDVLKNSLEAFDEARDTLRAQYHKEVEQILGEQFAPAWDDLQETLVQDHEGVWNSVKDFFSKATDSRRRIEDDVSRAWRGSVPVLERHAVAIARVTQKALGAPAAVAPVQGAPGLPTGTPLQKLGYVGADQEPITWQRPSDDDRKNLVLILAGRNNTGQEGAKLTAGYERAVKLLPALTLEYARVASLMPALVGVQPGSLEEASNRPDLIGQAVKQLGEGVTLGQTVLRSIATVLAVDVLTDGDVDVVKALSAIGLGGAATAAEGGAAGGAAAGGAAAIGGVGAAVVGLVAVGYLTYSAIKEVRRYDGQASMVAHQMLSNVKDHYQQHFLRHFDELMDQMRSRLRQSLRERYRLDELLMEQDRLAKAIADVRAFQRDLLDELGRKSVPLFNVAA